MPSSLQDLPPEILAHIVSYVDSTQILLNLALSCKKLHNYVENDGYRVFVQNQYPSVSTPPFWKGATHALTRLSQAWNRKSLIARCIEPPRAADGLRRGSDGRRARGQTMGYQPSIDSYETWIGSTWTSRKEVVAWAAGAELVLRIRWMGPEREEEWQQAMRNKADLTEFNQHGQKCRWWRIKDAYHRDGKDDITAVKLLRDSQKQACHTELVIVGRATGELDMISVNHESREGWRKETRFTHPGQTVRFAGMSSAAEPLLAVCLGDCTIAIYHVCLGRQSIEPIGFVQLTSIVRTCRIWSLVFLRHDRLAVGLGPSLEPIHIFAVGPDRIPSQPIRSFSVDEERSKGAIRRTVYSLAPLPQPSGAGRSEGDRFLSGGYDGVIRYVISSSSE